MSRTFVATVVPAGNATGVEVPAEVVNALGAGKRPPVTITVNGHTWRSRVASKDGRLLIGISAANRAASAIALGDEVNVTLELDTEPRLVAEPTDLAAALDADPHAREAFDRLPYGLRQKHVTAVEEAKSAGTRQRRISRLTAMLRDT
jgi:antitoxin component of MazEF toxin-antitoxin module